MDRQAEEKIAALEAELEDVRGAIADLRARLTHYEVENKRLEGAARELAEARQKLPKCAICGQPATCYGSYAYETACRACDDCCDHGGEDGWCVPIDEIPEAWGEKIDSFHAQLTAAQKQISDLTIEAGRADALREEVERLTSQLAQAREALEWLRERTLPGSMLNDKTYESLATLAALSAAPERQTPQEAAKEHFQAVKAEGAV